MTGAAGEGGDTLWTSKREKVVSAEAAGVPRRPFLQGPAALPCGLLFKTTRPPAVTQARVRRGVVLGRPGPIFPHSLDRDEPRSSVLANSRAERPTEEGV